MQDDGVPLVSVVMPCFNAEKFVDEAVRSALGQSWPSVELVVVDDGSTDSSWAILQNLKVEFGQRLTLLQSPRLGPYPARNLALRSVRGDFIAFLDADDWWEPDFVRTTLHALQGQPFDIAYCGWQNVGIDGPRGQPYVPPAYEEGDVVEHFLRSCPWPIHAALVRRDAITAIAGFSERMFSSMDYDLWIRLLTVTRRIVRVPRVLAYYRWHGGGQISATKWRQVLHAWQVRKDFVANNPSLVSHLALSQRRELVDEVLLHEGQAMFWRRDLPGAQRLLRQAFRTGAWRARDLPLLGAAHLPLALFRRLVQRADGGALQ